tara:strand:+ start:3447 stop:5030 length:1584 start_codon:yes stop_codon:yes gene_type:complete
MGISNVAVKTFDSTGSQSLCRTNEYKGDEEVKSSFISKCQKNYISGSGETVIPGSLRQFPKLKSVDTFYVNSDTDAISDITFNVEFKLRRPSGVTTSDWRATVTKDIILSLIDRVEIKIGSLNVQTLTADDIYIRNLTELGKPFSFSAPFPEPDNTTHTVEENVKEQRPTLPSNVWRYLRALTADVLKIQAACSIPFIGRSNDMSRSLLQAGALTNALTVKVYYNNIYKDNATPGNSHFQILSAGNATQQYEDASLTPSKDDFLDTSYFKSHLKIRTHAITETEKKFVSKNIVHRVVNTSSSITKEIDKNTGINSYTDSVTDIEVDLENISFNVSHLLIGVKLPHVKDKELSLPSTVTAPSDVKLQKLYNNELPTPFSVISAQTFYDNQNDTHSVTPDAVFGYMPDAIDSMELVLGSDRTGFISGVSAKIDACENFNLVNSDNTAHYIITLAEKAFDTSGIAFSKINNKKLLIKLNNSIFKNVSVPVTGHTIPNPLSSSSFAQNAIITVTACGTKVQSVVGGSMSFL